MNIYGLFFLQICLHRNLGIQTLVCDPKHMYFADNEESTAYLFVNELQTANEAETYCKSFGGQLVHLKSDTTLKLLRRFSLNWLKILGIELAKIEIYGLAANVFAQRFASPLNKKIQYSNSELQFNNYRVDFSSYIPLNYTQHLRQLWMHIKPTGDFNSVITFCSFISDIVVLEKLCPRKYEKNFQVYASVDPLETQEKLRVYVPKFNFGNVKSTPLTIETLDDMQLSYDQTHFFIPDINIFIGARSPSGTRVWVWSNGSLVEDFHYFVPPPDSAGCQHLTMPLLYDNGRNFKPQSCSEFKAYPVCQFKVIGDFRQHSCDGTEAKIVWRMMQSISSELSLFVNITILEHFRQGKRAEVNVFESRLYNFNVFNTVVKSLAQDLASYEVLWSLIFPQSVCQDKRILAHSRFSLTTTRNISVPHPPNVTVFSLSKYFHLCYFQIFVSVSENLTTLLYWQISINNTVLLDIPNTANLFGLQYMPITLDLTKHNITMKNPVFVVSASNCKGLTHSVVKGTCPPPKIRKQKIERIIHITKVLKPLQVQSLGKPIVSSFVMYFIVCIVGVVSGVISGVLFLNYRIKSRDEDSSSNESNVVESEVEVPQSNKS